MTMATLAPSHRAGSEPAWEVARLFPDQGRWKESDYFIIADTNRLVELVGGRLEVLEMPKVFHQRIVLYLRDLLKAFIGGRHPGEVLVSPTYMRLEPGEIREPDVLYLTPGRIGADGVCNGADMVMEVVSESRDSHQRDWEEKPREYAKAGIPEYWIVDPQLKKIVVLKLVGQAYETHSEAGETGKAYSALLPGFEVDAAAVWAAGEGRS
jgi:Uma2 family endonuclease